MYKHRTRRVERIIDKMPDFVCFKPAGIPRSKIETIQLLAEEYEAVRLVNLEWLNMKEGANKMGVSAPTFNRMVKSAHKKMTDAIVNGKGIRIFRMEDLLNK